MTPAFWADARVALSRVPPGNYGEATIRSAVGEVAAALGWGGSPEDPFSVAIPGGATVLIKPNWVHHLNGGSGGMEPLLTHPALIRAVTEGALASQAGRVIVGDAPLQACDFDALVEASGLGPWFQEVVERDSRLEGPEDFRRTRSASRGGVREALEDLRPETDFVLFDLGEESLLEPITGGSPGFRVTQYDPRLLANRHRRGRHQYLVAKQAVEADVVINLPKLKTHKKAGITCALKNLIGINGNKEFLPHHRLGGSKTGGDCYEGGGRFRFLLEKAMDRYNMAGTRAGARLWHEISGLTAWFAKNVDGSDEIEGAWSGNDTVWRTCLDLNRILLYGKLDGTMADTPQRREIHVVDAVTAGQGDGPLSPDPLPLGLVLAGGNGAAVDWIGAQLLGFDPRRIPISREAFGQFRWPLTSDLEEAVRAVGDGFGGGFDPASFFEGEIRHPSGWRGSRPRH